MLGKEKGTSPRKAAQGKRGREGIAFRAAPCEQKGFEGRGCATFRNGQGRDYRTDGRTDGRTDASAVPTWSAAQHPGTILLSEDPTANPIVS